MPHRAAWEEDVRIRIRSGRADSGVKLYVTDHDSDGPHEFMANTRFFRYPRLFDVLTGLLVKAEAVKSLRVCIIPLSVGLEAISFVIAGTRKGMFDRRHVTVEAFDISEKATELARLAIYPRLFFPDDITVYHGFLRELADGYVAVEDTITKHVRVLPAVDVLEFEPARPYDMIVCLNLLMFLFDEDKARLVDKLAAMTAPGQILCLNNNQEWPGELTPHFERLTAPGGGFVSLHDAMPDTARGGKGAEGECPSFAVTDANAMILRREAA